MQETHATNHRLSGMRSNKTNKKKPSGLDIYEDFAARSTIQHDRYIGSAEDVRIVTMSVGNTLIIVKFNVASLRHNL